MAFLALLAQPVHPEYVDLPPLTLHCWVKLSILVCPHISVTDGGGRIFS